MNEIIYLIKIKNYTLIKNNKVQNYKKKIIKLTNYLKK